MNYLWQEFNIKTFPAETIVYRDGVFIPELSTLESTDIDKNYKLPVHIIYFGEIIGDNNLNINISIPDQEVFLTVKIQNKIPAFLNIYIKNTGKNSFLKGKVISQNYSNLKIKQIGHHLASDTKIIIHTKVIAHSESDTKIIGTAIIEKNCKNCTSDIKMSALANISAKIEFLPSQLISSEPTVADHSASLYKGTDSQIRFLREAGLSREEIKQALREAFINDIDLF
ncbi:MAG: SufD family Fe-S cluster assembly protein [Alphaproteobacteria bacterium]|nr:SufD family Fe-S cluster assembly protein [Alphaproteobacteria bacterium]MBN2675360.1 SufD family Fe-S cluster assembly protein [Alphaproteobacteria bacterium]